MGDLCHHGRLFGEVELLVQILEFFRQLLITRDGMCERYQRFHPKIPALSCSHFVFSHGGGVRCAIVPRDMGITWTLVPLPSFMYFFRMCRYVVKQ